MIFLKETETSCTDEMLKLEWEKEMRKRENI